MFKAIVEDYKSFIVTEPVGIGENIFINTSFRRINIIQEKIAYLSKKRTLFHDWKNLAVVS